MVESILEALIPISIVCILPICIVWIVNRRGIISDKLRAEVLLKALESNYNIDADKLAEALRKPVKTAREIRNMRLLRGCMFTFVGVLFIVIALVGLCSGADCTADPVILPALAGSISLAIGVSYLIVWKVMGRQAAENSEAAEQSQSAENSEKKN